MGEDIHDLIAEAEERFVALEEIKKRYPDARHGEIYGKAIIASKLALNDCDRVILLVHRDRGDNMLVPFLYVRSLAVCGWSDAGPMPLEVVLKNLREQYPDAHEKLLEVCRR